MILKQSPPGFRNVSGPLIEAVQAQLNAAGYDAGKTDGVWGSKTVNALKAWRQANNLSPDATIDDVVWTNLMGIQVPALPQRALQLTGAWEGTGYGGANGNFDGQGITWGVVGFTWGNGELQSILNEIRTQYPTVFKTAFGQLAQEMVQVLGQPLPAQMTWARSISTNNGENIDGPWSDAFEALGADPQVQALENDHAQHYWDAGLVFAQDFGLQSENGLALCFDIAVQNTVAQSTIDEIQQKTAGVSENGKMNIIAHVIADHANPTYYNDVLKRKMTFVTGQGSVHGDLYDINCWGIG